MIYERKLAKFSKQSHRGIAGIIVSLILIAVAVVGGISVFMFTQGFISDSSVTAPTIEVIEIFGYDISDTMSVIAHTGAIISGINPGGSVDGVLGDRDTIVLYVRNRGSTIVAIDSIEVYGTTYPGDFDDQTCDTNDPSKGDFSISSTGALIDCGQTSIAPGEEVTIYVRYADTTNGEVALGRPIPITIITANGMEISKQLTNGAQVG